MKVSAILEPALATAAERAAAAEALGYDGAWMTEIAHDPFLPLLLAAGSTTRLEVGTAIAVAFPRSPTHLAQLANDLHAYSQGRFVLGLGSQVKAHVERRFGATWSSPVARMRELVLAIRAVWSSWNEGEPLDFRGDFYELTLMTPFFSPEPNPYGTPKIFLAAVGPRMVTAVGEVADGLLVHGFTTVRYLEEMLTPALEEGLARAGRDPGSVEVSRQLFCVTGRDEEELAAKAQTVKEKLAFYGSTPAYRPVLELHGWGDVQPELAELARRGEWSKMADVIDDEMLAEFAVVGAPEDVPRLVAERFGGRIDRVSFNAPFTEDPELWGQVVSGIQEVPGRGAA